MLTTTEIASVFSVGVHGTTYGGNPLACAVAGAVFDVINTTEVLDGVKARHALFMEGLKAINARRRVFRDLRGEGVWLGCELDDPWRGKAMDVMRAAGDAGLLVLIAGPDVVRIAPSLVISLDEILEGLARLETALNRALTLTLRTPMFFVRPIARDDLPAVLALSERTGTGLTTLPANRERLAAAHRALARVVRGHRVAPDACYMFVLVDVGRASASSASARSRRRSGLPSPGTTIRVGTLVHASRALDVYTAAPTLFLANDHTGHTELCSLFLDEQFRHGKNGPLLAKSRLLFIAEFAQRFAPKVIAELRGPLDAGRDAARSGKVSAGISSRWSTRRPTT